ncbi:RNA-directed DNA polymerase, eukaryota, partial [Tanacetum coccineum]
VRDGYERQQWLDLMSTLGSISLSSAVDRWVCDLNGDGEFRVKDIRSSLDNLFLPAMIDATRWVKYIPVKVNVFAWRARLDRLPTRGNLVSRGVFLDSSLCPVCGLALEDVQHVLFRCDMAKLIFNRICRWWDLHWVDVSSFEDWDVWFGSIRLPSKLKIMLEGVEMSAISEAKREDIRKHGIESSNKNLDGDHEVDLQQALRSVKRNLLCESDPSLPASKKQNLVAFNTIGDSSTMDIDKDTTERIFTRIYVLHGDKCYYHWGGNALLFQHTFQMKYNSNQRHQTGSLSLSYVDVGNKKSIGHFQVVIVLARS